MTTMLYSAAVKRAGRDWRLREIRILFLALTVAVVAVTSISFFTNRVERAMHLQGTALLGADLLIRSSRPVSKKVRQLTEAYTQADIVEFRSVILSGENSLLSEIKAVTGDYPLRGTLETSDTLGSIGTRTTSAPQSGEAWAAPDIFYQLGLSPGGLIQLGNSTFKLTRIINFEPDAGGSVFRLAPRLMINIESLADTGLLTPASRATYKLLISGSEKNMIDLRQPLKQVLAPSETLLSVEEGRPEVSAALNRAVRFMKLASVLTIIIAGAAVALAVLSYTRRERHNIAVLKTLGATRTLLWRDYALRFIILVLLASIVGSLLGFFAQFFLTKLLSSLLHIALPPASLKPLGAGIATAMLTLAGFALPP
ncbi:MAG: ABC transporter permease, partial [Proteobacteria bacterium]|nr:ABC transporter permease [Pseudomonadota bacterium]